MRITQIRYHGVAVSPTETALFRIEEGLSLQEQIKRAASIKWIVEVETDEGIVGIGESHRGLHRREVEAIAELRKRIGIPIAYHALSVDQVIQAIKIEACDCMNVGFGGPAEFVLMSGIADAAAIPTWHGSAMELGIRDAAYLHACAASKGCTLSSDILHHLWQDDLIAHPIEIKGGRARVPEGPGLGVELDYDALEHHLVKRASILS